MNAQNSQWSWAKSFQNENNASRNTSFMDNQKNIYHLGTFTAASITIEQNVITNSSEATSNPNVRFPDSYITKHDPEGNILFVKHFNGSRYEVLTSVAYDNNNNFYVTGFFNGNITLGTTTYQAPNNESKCFIAKLDLSGNIVWSKPINYIGDPILKFKDNNLYLTGIHTGNTFTYDNITTPSVGYTAVIDNMDKTFVAKLDLSGNAIWLKSSTYNGTTTINDAHRIGTQPNGLAIDNLGNVYVTGVFFCRSTTWGTQTVNKTAAPNNANLFIAKYDAAGNFGWASSAATTSASHTIVGDMQVDGLNNIYLLGQIYNSTANFGGVTINFPGNTGSFLAKYSTTGTVAWVRGGKISSDAQPGTNLGLTSFEKMYVDSGNNVHVTGTFLKYINFGNNYVVQNPDWTTNLFSVKFDGSGNASEFFKLAEIVYARELKILDVTDDVFYYSGKLPDTALTLGDITLNNTDINQLTYIAKRDRRLSVDEFENNFTIYPNPAQDQINISGTDLATQNILFAIFDINGKKIKSVQSENAATTSIDVKNLASGTYVLKIEADNSNKSFKFVKN